MGNRTGWGRPALSRSGITSPLGKFTAEFPKFKAPEDIKDEAERMAKEAGMSLSEWVREVVMLRVIGIERMRSLHLSRLNIVAGTRGERGGMGNETVASLPPPRPRPSSPPAEGGSDVGGGVRDYARVGPKFWIGTTGRAIRTLGAEAQVLALYLMTSPHANMLGVYHLPIAYIVADTGMSIEGATKGLQSLSDVAFCSYDGASEVVFVHEMARYQIADELKANDKQVAGVNKEYKNLPANKYLGDFFDKYQAAFKLTEKRVYEAPSKPLPSQEQEQEQEQAKEKPLVGSEPKLPAGFVRFWDAWPSGDRKQAKGKCMAAWERKRMELKADVILRHVEALKTSRQWREGYVPAPLTYLNQERFDGADCRATGSAEAMIFGDTQERSIDGEAQRV